MDQILLETGGDLAKIEQRLGFDPGHFSTGGGLVRVDIADPIAHGARLPSGLEQGANSNFVYGGYTSGGVPEAVLNPVPTSQTTTSFL